MDRYRLARQEKTWGDTAVDGLLAGLAGGGVMLIGLEAVGWLAGTAPLTMLGYFDPALTGNWLTGLLAHFAVAAIYGVVFAVLLRVAGRLRPSIVKRAWLWGMAFGLLLWGLAVGALRTAVASPLNQIPAWTFGLAHLLYGLALGLWLERNHSGG